MRLTPGTGHQSASTTSHPQGTGLKAPPPRTLLGGPHANYQLSSLYKAPAGQEAHRQSLSPSPQHEPNKEGSPGSQRHNSLKGPGTWGFGALA